MWFWQPRGEEIQICLTRKAHLATSCVVCFAKKGIKITSHPRILSHWECSVLPFPCLGVFLQGGLKPKQTESLRSPSATAASGITARGHACHLSRKAACAEELQRHPQAPGTCWGHQPCRPHEVPPGWGGTMCQVQPAQTPAPHLSREPGGGFAFQDPNNKRSLSWQAFRRLCRGRVSLGLHGEQREILLVEVGGRGELKEEQAWGLHTPL